MKGKILCSLGLLSALSSLPAYSAEDDKKQPIPLGAKRPLVAVWSDSQGFKAGSAPALRIAVWEDGRVLFASDPKKWGSDLLEGKISPAKKQGLWKITKRSSSVPY